MLKLLLPTVAKELCTIHGHVPFFLRHLHNLNPAAKRIAVLYLHWRMGRMHPVDIHVMLASDQVSVEDLDFFAAEAQIR